MISSSHTILNTLVGGAARWHANDSYRNKKIISPIPFLEHRTVTVPVVRIPHTQTQTQ
jgi:hypothetical protein